MKRFVAALILCLGLSAVAHAQNDGELKFAALGDFRLEGGEVLPDCRVGYRTYGKLDASRSNAVLFPTWFGGTSDQLASNFGPGKMVDSSKYFVIAVDALGNGVSSSPSNTPQRKDAGFPDITIRDMVRAEYQLVTRTLGIAKLHAVIGISMGGMQTFQWVVSYPEMMDKAIPIVGTTRQTPYDLLLWSTELRAIEDAAKYRGNADAAAAMVARIHALALFTPEYRNRAMTSEGFKTFIETEESNYARTFKAWDWASQLKAMMAHDVSSGFESFSTAAWRVRAKMMIVVARQDMMVNPDPAIDFARLLKAEVVEVNNDCGHVYAMCSGETVSQQVARFLARSER